MTVVYATHGAAALKQIDTVTIAGTWAGTNTCTLTINGKDLVVTIGTGTSTPDVAKAIRDAWNASTRLDSENGSTDATSNFGGQEFGEYAEVIASIDDDATSVVVLTANRAGIPFTLSVADTASGSATQATAQAATGPWHWDNGDNWSGGSAPANDDVVVLKDQSGPNVGFKYGLPNASKEVTIQHWMSYTGQIGLPPINNDNPAKPYPEYRQQYLRLDDAGTGTNIAHRFGLGKDGTGSPMINLKHTVVKCSPVIYNTGTPQVQGLKALNICCSANTSTITVVNGSVDCSSQDSGTSAFVTLTMNGGDVRAVNAMHTTGAGVYCRGGMLLIGGTAINGINVYGGVCRIENQTGAITGLFAYGNGIVEWLSAATVTTANFYDQSTFDARPAAGVGTLTDTYIYGNQVKFLDPFSGVTYTNPIHYYGELSQNVQLGGNLGSYISLTP